MSRLPLLLFRPIFSGTVATKRRALEQILHRRHRFAVVAVGITFFVVCRTCVGMDVVALARGSLAFNMALKKAFPGKNGFTAKLQVEFQNPDGTRLAWPMKISQAGAFMRGEYRLTECEMIPTQAQQALARVSMDLLVTILNTEKKRVWILFPGIQGYMEFAAPPSLVEKIDYLEKEAVPQIFVANENLNGHVCRKFRISKTSDPELAFAWRRQDLKEFPVKIQSTRAKDVMTIDALSVDLSMPKSNQFEVGQGYRRFDSFEAAMSAAIQRSRQSATNPQPPR